MNQFEKIGGLIKQKRENIRLSQDFLAAKIGVSKSTISLYESGDRKPSLARLTQIAQELQTPLNEFLAMENPKKVNLDLALRAEGISSADIESIKKYIKFIMDEQQSK